jgi:hypothetical protein
MSSGFVSAVTAGAGGGVFGSPACDWPDACAAALAPMRRSESIKQLVIMFDLLQSLISFIEVQGAQATVSDKSCIRRKLVARLLE